MIVFDEGCLDQVAAAAERAYPEECCGLLIGRKGDVLRVTAVVESDNIAPYQRSRRFEIDPALRLAVMRRLGDGGDEIVGHYHSHPEGGATPSAHDASMVFEPDLLWLIVGMAEGRAQEIRCWYWDPVAACFCPRNHHSQPRLVKGATG